MHPSTFTGDIKSQQLSDISRRLFRIVLGAISGIFSKYLSGWHAALFSIPAVRHQPHCANVTFLQWDSMFLMEFSSLGLKVSNNSNTDRIALVFSKIVSEARRNTSVCFHLWKQTMYKLQNNIRSKYLKIIITS